MPEPQQELQPEAVQEPVPEQLPVKIEPQVQFRVQQNLDGTILLSDSDSGDDEDIEEIVNAPASLVSVESAVSTKVNRLAEQLEKIKVSTRSMSKRTALVLEINSHQRAEPTQEAVEEVARVLSAPAAPASTSKSVKCLNCGTMNVSEKGLKIHLGKKPACKAYYASLN